MATKSEKEKNVALSTELFVYRASHQTETTYEKHRTLDSSRLLRVSIASGAVDANWL
jgi:hypothetical protein